MQINVLEELRDIREHELETLFPNFAEKLKNLANRMDEIENFCRERTEGAVGWAYKEILAMLRGEE